MAGFFRPSSAGRRTEPNSTVGSTCKADDLDRLLPTGLQSSSVTAFRPTARGQARDVARVGGLVGWLDAPSRSLVLREPGPPQR